jgi:hypothetical protein
MTAAEWRKVLYPLEVAIAAKPSTINAGLPPNVCEQLHESANLHDY